MVTSSLEYVNVMSDFNALISKEANGFFSSRPLASHSYSGPWPQLFVQSKLLCATSPFTGPTVSSPPPFASLSASSSLCTAGPNSLVPSRVGLNLWCCTRWGCYWIVVECAVVVLSEVEAAAIVWLWVSSVVVVAGGCRVTAGCFVVVVVDFIVTASCFGWFVGCGCLVLEVVATGIVLCDVVWRLSVKKTMPTKRAKGAERRKPNFPRVDKDFIAQVADVVGCRTTPMNDEQREEAEKTVVGEFNEVKHVRGILSMGRARLNFSPLGACALAGTGLPIDRFMTSDALGFTAPLKNRACDRATIKFCGVDADINFDISDYEDDLIQ
ncbi:hypothetical protein Drorol1_Dr00016214 [Drosera rotundifolia]